MILQLFLKSEVVKVKKIIAIDKLPALWARLAEEAELILPVQDGPVVLFNPGSEGAEVELEAFNSAVSPKDLFLPREETYLHYHCSGQSGQIGDRGRPPVTAFGIHPCDLKAIEMLDKVFMDQEPPTVFTRNGAKILPLLRFHAPAPILSVFVEFCHRPA
jgi:sulfhydrogenase subunit beta (sulfur reductase)